MDDLISRQAAIDVEGIDEQIRCEMCKNPMQTDRGCDGNCKYDEKLYERIMQILGERIKPFPPAQPEPRWIPCSERLPDDGRQVLVYARSVHYALAKYDEMREADGTYKKQWVTFDAWKPYYTIKEVVAWMPLPEPYKGGDTNE